MKTFNMIKINNLNTTETFVFLLTFNKNICYKKN